MFIPFFILDSGSRTSPNLVSINSQQILQDTKEKGVSMTYICRLQPRPGALNLDKCVRMGISQGPLLGKLKGGEEVVLPNGNIVTSKDVCEPDDPGPIFISSYCLRGFIIKNSFYIFSCRLSLCGVSGFPYE